MADWTPILNGEVYCSPACGHGCRRAVYEWAVASATAVAGSLGEGWKPRVWENLGWHWSVETEDRRVKVHPGGLRSGPVLNGEDYASGIVASWTAYLSPEASSGGRWAENRPSIREALVAVHAAAKDEARAIAQAIWSIEAVLEREVEDVPV